jgi:O-antigen ligase
MIGIDSATSFSAIATHILDIETLILGLFLVFSMFTAWQLQRDPLVVMPKLPFTRIFTLVGLVGLWVIFTFSLGIDQNLIALEIALSILLAMIHPAMAIGLFLMFLFLRPWEVAESGQTVYGMIPRGFAAIAGISSIFYLVRARTMTFRLGKPFLGLFAFAIWTFLSTFKSSDPGSIQKIYFDMFFKSVVLFILITQSIRDEIGFRILKASLIFAGLGISSISIFHAVTVGNGSRVGSFGLLADPNDISAVMVLILPFAIHVLHRRDPSLFLRLICLATAAASLVLFYYAKSRGAVLAVLATLATMVILKMKNKRLAIIGGVVALCLFIPISTQFKRSQNDLSASTESRLIYWKTGTMMALRSPVFGVGFAGYPENFDRYTSKFIESGLRTAHSSWFLVLAETGFLGFFLFFSLYFWALKTAWAYRVSDPDVFLATVGYGVAMSFLSHTYSIYFYILLGVVFVVSRLPRNTVKALVLLFIAGAGLASPSFAMNLEAVRGSDKPIGTFTPPTRKTLELSGSRGEVLNFQLKVKISDCSKLSVQGLPPSTHIRFYHMPYFKTEHASFPGAYVGSHHDPLIPLADDGLICPEKNAKKEPAWFWLWGEVKINRDQPPGKFDAKLLLKSKEKDPVVLPVQLQVWKMMIPDEPAVALYSEYSSWYGTLGHFGKDDRGDVELAKRYALEMREHRISPIKSWIAVPKSDDTKKLFHEVVLKGSQAWELVDFPKPIQASPKEQEEYWNGVEQEILSQNLKDRAIVYLWDEPQKKEIPEIVALSKKIREWAPHLKILVTSSDPALEKSVDLFVPILNQWGAREEKLRKDGKAVWTYLSCMSHGCQGAEESGLPDWVLDRPSVWIRSMAWVAGRLRLTSTLYYNVNYAYQFYPKKDVWNDQWYFTGNGDGTLFYPGRPGEHGLKEHQPVDSIRVKVWRESSFDAEYVRWMENLKSKPDWWKTKYDALVKGPKTWSKNYPQYQELRDRAGDYLNGLKEK